MADLLAVLIGLISIFFILGTALPFIQHDFGMPEVKNNFIDSTVQQPNDTNPVTAPFSWLAVLFSIIKMFFWTFGQVPLIIELILEFFRIIMYICAFMLIRGNA